jgi:nickel-dependent lactate racemase
VVKVDIPYGKNTVEISVDVPFEMLVPNTVILSDEYELIKNALQKPYGDCTFFEFVDNAEKLLVIVNDATRPTPTAKIIDFLFPVFRDHPYVRFLIATGVHRGPTEEELRFIFGKHLDVLRDKIVVHDARKEQDMEYLGKSSNGTEMYLNRLLTEMKNVIPIGSVEPHYFAGYTGGRKSFLPGVASYKTIEMNHKLALSDDARSLSLEGNPVNEDMIDAMQVLQQLKVFSIQTILSGDHQLYAVTAGDLHQSFDAAIQYAHQVFCVPLRQKGNIVVTVAPYPMDIDFYQSQKALDNGKLALMDKGIMIMVSKCRMGVGEDAFLDLLCRASTPEGVLQILNEEYQLGFHKAAKMAQIGKKADMWAVTDLDDKIVKKAMMKPYASLQTAVDDAVKMVKSRGMDPRMIIMPAGSLTVPMIKEGAK